MMMMMMMSNIVSDPLEYFLMGFEHNEVPFSSCCAVDNEQHDDIVVSEFELYSLLD